MKHLALLSAGLFAVTAWAQEGNPYYTIFPTESTATDANDAFTKDLYSKVKKDIVFLSQSATLGTMYWYAPLSDDNRDYFAKKAKLIVKPGVNAEQQPTHTRRSSKPDRVLQKSETTSQARAPEHLKFVSQPQGKSIDSDTPYQYDNSAGEESRVYIIDSGLTASHPQLEHLTNPENLEWIEWLWAGPFGDHSKKDDADTEWGHGTAMASVAVGSDDGVAKSAGLTVGEDRSSIAVETWLDGLAQTYDNITNSKREGKAVVSMSIGFDPPNNEAYRVALEEVYSYVINEIINDLDCPVLVAAGQPAFGNPDVITLPATLAGSTAPNIIVVSGCNDEGHFDDTTRIAEYVKILAPADNVEVASGAGTGTYPLDGTSPATAMTAGLVAYFQTLNGGSGAPARQTLYDNSWSRDDRSEAAIYNGIEYNGFKAGKCTVDVREGSTLNKNTDGFTVAAIIYGADGRIIGQSSGFANSLDVTSALPYVLVVSTTWPYDTVSFAYSDQTWSTDNQHGPGNTDNECREGPYEQSVVSPFGQFRSIHCTFTC